MEQSRVSSIFLFLAMSVLTPPGDRTSVRRVMPDGPRPMNSGSDGQGTALSNKRVSIIAGGTKKEKNLQELSAYREAGKVNSISA